MTQWFKEDTVPGIERLPLTRGVIETLNATDGKDASEVLKSTVQALVFAVSALEGRQNQLMEFLNITEGGLRPGEYDGVKNAPQA